MPSHRIKVMIDQPDGTRLQFNSNETRLSPDRSKFYLYDVTLEVNGKRIHGVKGTGTITNPHPDKKPGQRPPMTAIKYRLAHAIAVRLGYGTTKSGADKQVRDWFAVNDHCDVRRQRQKKGLEQFTVWLMEDEPDIVAILVPGELQPGEHKLLGLRYDKAQQWPDDELYTVTFTAEKPD